MIQYSLYTCSGDHFSISADHFTICRSSKRSVICFCGKKNEFICSINLFSVSKITHFKSLLSSEIIIDYDKDLKGGSIYG